jgi:TetR/AcrR family transcriptional regulator
MAAPALARPTDVPKELLAHATRLFANQGFDGTTLQEIADAVGIRKPSLLYHFASKDELRQAVLEDVLARWKDTLPELLLAATAGEGQFDAITRAIVSFFVEDPDRARVLVREALDKPNDMRDRLATHVRPLVGNLARYVERGQSQGRVYADLDPEAYLFQIVVLLLAGVAFSESFYGLMPSSDGDPRQRLHRELVRIAKASLFISEAAPASTRQRRKKRSGRGKGR